MKRCAENFNQFCPDYPEKCHLCGAFREPTNADRTRAMSDEELVGLFRKIYDAGADNAIANEFGIQESVFIWDESWLQQPAEEADHEL